MPAVGGQPTAVGRKPGPSFPGRSQTHAQQAPNTATPRSGEAEAHRKVQRDVRISRMVVVVRQQRHEHGVRRRGRRPRSGSLFLQKPLPLPRRFFRLLFSDGRSRNGCQEHREGLGRLLLDPGCLCSLGRCRDGVRRAAAAGGGGGAPPNGRLERALSRGPWTCRRPMLSTHRQILREARRPPPPTSPFQVQGSRGSLFCRGGAWGGGRGGPPRFIAPRRWGCVCPALRAPGAGLESLTLRPPGDCGSGRLRAPAAERTLCPPPPPGPWGGFGEGHTGRGHSLTDLPRGRRGSQGFAPVPPEHRRATGGPGDVLGAALSPGHLRVGP